MGCGSSSAPRVNPARQIRPIIDFSTFDTENFDGSPPQTMLIEISDFLSQNFSEVLTGITHIPKPPNVRPIVCINDNVLPIVSGQLCLSSGDATKVNLPVAAIGVYSQGKTVCLGSINILAECVSTNTEASAFLENISRYCCGMLRASYRVLLLGLPTKVANDIKKNFSVFEFSADIENDKNDFSKYGTVICTTQLTPSPELKSYLQQGGGLICGFTENDNTNNTYFHDSVDYPMRKFLLEMGYGFPECSLSIGGANSNSLRSDRKFKHMSQLTLPNLANSFFEMVEEIDTIDAPKYDTLVTTLRYYILALDRTDSDLLKKLFEKCWDILDQTNASNNTSVCPTIIHGITFVLISEMLSKIPAKFCEGMERCVPFPGKIGTNFELADYRTHAEFHWTASWFSTGLYIPPGVVSTVTLDKILPNVKIQIGSHTDCILSKLGPWRRWAIVTSLFEFDSETIEISSPYGGIVYIVCGEIDDDMDIEIDVTFRQIGRHPSFMIQSPESFVCFDVPWGEIETNFVIFTVPTECIREMEDIAGFCNFIDDILSKVLHFTSDQSVKLFRVVFDVELVDDRPTAGYPIIFSVDMINVLFFNTKKPTAELFVLLEYIATTSMPEGIFEQPAIEAFASLAAASAFVDTWEDIDPIQYIVNTPSELFNALYGIYQKNSKKALINAFAKVRESTELLSRMVKPDLWSLFVQKIALETKESTDKLLRDLVSVDTATSGKMVMTYSSSSLCEFQLNESQASNSKIIV